MSTLLPIDFCSVNESVGLISYYPQGKFLVKYVDVEQDKGVDKDGIEIQKSKRFGANNQILDLYV